MYIHTMRALHRTCALHSCAALMRARATLSMHARPAQRKPGSCGPSGDGAGSNAGDEDCGDGGFPEQKPP